MTKDLTSDNKRQNKEEMLVWHERHPPGYRINVLVQQCQHKLPTQGCLFVLLVLKRPLTACNMQN